jgi:ribosomal protein S18 acetylase RimI-like enzyme
MLAEYSSVREARFRDAAALAAVFRDSWQFAYQGIIPQAHLACMIDRRGITWWRDNLRQPRSILIAEANGTVAGYVTYGRSRNAVKFQGEIYELYVAPAYLGLGLGERLFESARQKLDELDLRGLIVWALTDNAAACDFYWRRGGRPAAKSSERFGGTVLPKTGYGWE